MFVACSPHYIASDFKDKTLIHTQVAILPIAIEHTGNLPDEWTAEDIFHIEEAESRSFQISLYREILRSTRNGRKPLSVDIQHYRKTQQILVEAGITISDSWQMDPQMLASTLGVDAVVIGNIRKTRYMSDLASYGIEVGTHIFNLITQHQFFPWIPITSQSKNVQVSYELIDRDGVTLWSTNFDESANWRRPANEIIDGISRRAAQKFPYRSKQ